MNHQPSNAEITHIKSHLLAALNGVKINRYNFNSKGKRTGVAQTIRVPVKYGHKTRQIHEAIQINGQITLPIISVTMSGISLDPSRNEAKKQPIYDFQYTGEDGITKYIKPTPINVNFNVAMVTKKGSDMEELIAHYLSVFNPYIYVSWKHPYTNKDIRSKVLWDGSLSTSYPTDIDSESKIRYICNFGVTVESWIFREESHAEKLIKEIKYNIGIDQNLSECHFDIDDGFVGDDSYTIKGIPDIYNISPKCLEVGQSIIVDGENFNFLDGVFFTPISGNIPTQEWNPFILSESLSAVHPVFEAFMLEEWQVVDDERMIITIPPSLSSSVVELGLINRHCGIVKSSETLSGSCHEPYLTIT